MKMYLLEDGNVLYDLGKLLVLSPFKLEEREECGGWQETTTKKGRRMIVLLPGKGYYTGIYCGSGDRGWNNWDNDQVAVAHHSAAIFSFAAATSHGGGCWIEFWIYPIELKPKDPYNIRPNLTKFRPDIVNSL